jgi:hypothetical protein
LGSRKCPRQRTLFKIFPVFAYIYMVLTSFHCKRQIERTWKVQEKGIYYVQAQWGNSACGGLRCSAVQKKCLWSKSKKHRHKETEIALHGWLSYTRERIYLPKSESSLYKAA